MVDRVSSCGSREEGDSAECCRASARCGAFVECGSVSFECSSMISFCRRVSDCEDLESDMLEGLEEGGIVKIWMACSV